MYKSRFQHILLTCRFFLRRNGRWPPGLGWRWVCTFISFFSFTHKISLTQSDNIWGVLYSSSSIFCSFTPSQRPVPLFLLVHVCLIIKWRVDSLSCSPSGWWRLRWWLWESIQRRWGPPVFRWWRGKRLRTNSLWTSRRPQAVPHAAHRRQWIHR